MTIDDEDLCGWTIYCDTVDFPWLYAVRRWWVMEAGVVAHAAIACLCHSLEEARENVPLGTIRFDREPEDDPVIVETWM